MRTEREHFEKNRRPGTREGRRGDEVLSFFNRFFLSLLLSFFLSFFLRKNDESGVGLGSHPREAQPCDI